MATRTRTRKSRGSSRTKKKKFVYKKRTKEQYNRAAAESSGNWDSYLTDGLQMFKPHDGQNQIRILPPTFDDANDFGLTIHVHYGIGANSDTYLCPKMLDKANECPVCEEVDRLIKDGEQDEASEFKMRKRKLVWLLDRKSDEPKTPRIWSMPFGVFQDLILICKDEDQAVIDIDDPEEGCDVLFTKEGTGKKTNYGGLRLGRPRPLLKDEDDAEAAIDVAVEKPLDEILNFYDAEYVASVLEGTAAKSSEDDDDDDEDEEDDDERSSRSRKRRSSKKKSTRSRRRKEEEEEDDDDDDDEDEDEDDEDDSEDDDEDEDEGEDEDEDEDEDEEDDEDEDDEDEDDEDEEDDEDDEDEKPARRKRTRKSSGSSRLKSAASRSRKRTAKKTARRRSR